MTHSHSSKDRVCRKRVTVGAKESKLVQQTEMQNNADGDRNSQFLRL